jgi:hypothetical protein
MKLKKKNWPFQYKVTKQAFQSEETEGHLWIGIWKRGPGGAILLASSPSAIAGERAAIGRQK